MIGSVIAAAVLAHTVWVDLPDGISNGNVPDLHSCVMKEGTPIASVNVKQGDGTRLEIQVYAPGHQTYGSECPPGIPVPPQ